jgi:anti-sigma regulatory factor (Ser/Thr protein kinase)
MEKIASLDGPQRCWSIGHSTDVAAARRYGLQLSRSLGFDEGASGRVSLIITEAAGNVLKHAGEGKLFLTQVSDGDINGIEILALDRGPGISDLAHSLNDGVTTTGTPGNGLGALLRLSDRFDAYTGAGKGSAFYMCVWSSPPVRRATALEAGAICVPVPPEEVCGDGWGMTSSQDSATFLLSDGLGHGINAAHASRTARELLIRHPALQPGAFMEAAHRALHRTRGAAMAVARLHYSSEQLGFAGIGNISACVTDGLSQNHLVSHNGIVGHNMRKVQEFTVPFPRRSLYIMHSDGIKTHWDLAAYPGLYLRHPALIAAIIYRDFARDRDDASVFVIRRTYTSQNGFYDT